MMRCVVFALFVFTGKALSCSFDSADLIDWSSVSAWDDKVPKEGEYAIIRTGKKVRLDVSPPPLKGITIESGASLVWGDVGDLVVTTDYIYIKGEFVIGDSDCPFTKKANIKLTGKYNTDNTVAGFGRKFIGVAAGGTIELHGAVKKQWTKLIQTIPAAKDTCGTIFDFQESAYYQENGQGLFVLAFNVDGTLFDMGSFRTQNSADADAEEEFKTFVEDIPDGKVVVVAVNGDLGTGSVTREWGTVYDAVESLSGINPTTLKNVTGREAYAMIVKKGDHSTAKEQYVGNTQSLTSVSTRKLDVVVSDTVFSVVGIVYSSSNINRALDVKTMLRDVAYPKLHLNANVRTWKEGDEIVVTTTDFSMDQTEQFTVMDCDDCEKNQVRVNHPFQFMHYGEVTQGVDERAEVGMLTQSIRIEGVMEEQCYHFDDEQGVRLCELFDEDTHGGHLKVVKDFAAAHIEHVELLNMGQQMFVGSYALHFHMCGDVAGNWFRYNSIHKCHSRCVTIHGTDKAEVKQNVCYGTKGHSFFVEDSCEQENTFNGNLGISTGFGTHILSDMNPQWVNDSLRPFTGALSTYWITHPNNYIKNNIAAGSRDVGFWYSASLSPLGACKNQAGIEERVPKYHAFHSKIALFYNNKAHSCTGRGLRVDHRISNGEWSGDVWVPENGLFGAQSSHVPRNPPNPNGTLVTSVMKRFTAYKNGNQNVWTKAGNLVMSKFTLADATKGIAMARSNEGPTFTEITQSLFIGESDNKGVPEQPWDRSYAGDERMALQGVELYQGPGYVTDSFFDKYTHKYADGNVFRPAGGMSFKQDTPYPSTPSGGTRNITYGYCDGPDTNWVFQGNASLFGFGSRDGNRMASFRDYDGSITGTANTQIVNSHRFFTTDRCSHRQSWNVDVCPYDYARVVFSGNGGSFDKSDKLYPVYMTRDDRPDDWFAVEGETEDSYLVIKNTPYMVKFNGTTPNTINILGQSLETGEYIRVGLCLPTDAEFKISGELPFIDNDNPAFAVNSLADLDSDTTGRAYYWDSTYGLLFVKVIGYSSRLNKENCPGYTCPSIKVTMKGGTPGNYTCSSAHPTYTTAEDSSTPIPTPPPCSTRTYEGYGAPVEANRYTTQTFSLTCPAAPSSPVLDFKGCYKEMSSAPDLPFHSTTLSRSMTIQFCVTRCEKYNKAYAAIKNGATCSCGDFYGAYISKPGSCTKPCGGNADQECGAFDKISVFSTGIAPPAALTPCGPDNEGGVINNRCYYLTPDKHIYTDGQSACVNLGGNLATITTSTIQYGVEQYMRPYQSDAWFGLNDVATEGSTVYIDGTVVGTYTNILPGQGAASNQDGFMLRADSLYAWDDKSVEDKYRALCELPSNAQSPAAVSCGTDNHGKQFGSGPCVAVLNTPMSKVDAEYACYTRLGSLATITDTNKNDILRHIYVHGDGIDYWTGELASNGDLIKLDYSNVLTKSPISSAGQLNGVVCDIETLSASNRCPDGWEEGTDHCFLYTGRSASSYAAALQICDQGSSSIVIPDTAAVNTFVKDVVNNDGSAHVFIGLKYDSGTSSFQWEDDTTYDPDTALWQTNHGEGRALNGEECVRMNSLNGSWKNRECNLGGYVVCQTQAGG